MRPTQGEHERRTTLLYYYKAYNSTPIENCRNFLKISCFPRLRCFFFMETIQNSIKTIFHAPKDYVTKRTNKLLTYSKVCEQALTLCLERYTLYKWFAVRHTVL